MKVVVDTSVVLKWFHAVNEAEVTESQAILAAHRDELLTAYLLDLGIYEFGNILLRALKWSSEATADQLDDLLVICGPPLSPTPQWRRVAASLAQQHGLTFYDALFAAAAQALDAPLISMDRQLLAAGLAETPMTFTSRIGLLPPTD
jgi:predicted nucleic acid-binding protein